MIRIKRAFSCLLSFSIVMSQINAMDADQSYVAAGENSENQADGPYIINDILPAIQEASCTPENVEPGSFLSLLQRKPRMRLGIDIDGTIANTQDVIIDLYNREFGSNVQLTDVAQYPLEKLLVVLENSLSDSNYSHYSDCPAFRKIELAIYENVKPFPYATECLRKLATQHNIYFLSARMEKDIQLQVTKDWLTKHGFPFNGNNLYIGVNNKGRFAKFLELDLMIEDEPVHLDNLHSAGIPIVAFDASYNRDYSNQHYRILSWKECYEQLKHND